jgi:negative regulator of flagellin synthesis FlgM
MKVRGPADIGGANPVHSVGSVRIRNVQGVQAAWRSDTVEISEIARFLDKLSRLPDIRQDLVDAVKEQIAKGTYETPEKLAKAVENLLAELW